MDVRTDKKREEMTDIKTKNNMICNPQCGLIFEQNFNITCFKLKYPLRLCQALFSSI